ncbi:fimbria/pilus periplasmic chaperone [Citrobacter sp. Cb003]|uniref:fimbria/pilus periplasmic chaperone n=1 Tax=Citrobacter sp. Cb003 TaxID=2985005 RepID=UPI00257B87C2|nr:fimbria/pilus periplasmic chaperone [Citrobacter sp. Cb003]MDM3379286.1 fimbria/pilus periplasmic chaperone [Citrobacter sp. Cb003]
MVNTLIVVGLQVLTLQIAQAALTVDRSRLVLNEGDKSVSLSIRNANTQDPYLAQGWLEDGNENKIQGPLMVLPPVQRVEAGGKTLIRIQELPEVANLPKDRESIFYFNLREIPPKNEQPNVLTLAIQTRMKVFWRPKALKVDPYATMVPGTETVVLEKQNNQYLVNNPTPYHLTFVEGRRSEKGRGVENFEPTMVAPKSKTLLGVSASILGNTPALVFINDYGSQRVLPFNCSGNLCKAQKVVNPGNDYSQSTEMNGG